MSSGAVLGSDMSPMNLKIVIQTAKAADLSASSSWWSSGSFIWRLFSEEQKTQKISKNSGKKIKQEYEWKQGMFRLPKVGMHDWGGKVSGGELGEFIIRQVFLIARHFSDVVTICAKIILAAGHLTENIIDIW